MAQTMTHKHMHFFGETAFYTTDQEKKKAQEYLEYWRDNLLKKMNRECGLTAKLIDEQLIDRDPVFDGALSIRHILSLRLALEIEFKYEIDNYLGST